MRSFNGFRKFVQLESAGGILLFATAVLALLCSNSPWHRLYTALVYYPLGISFGDQVFAAPLALWINDGLMVIFFLFVGLEIKREVLIGGLNTRARRLLPGVAALGGMIVPGLIYLICNFSDTVTLRGWAIPTATDIAFALGVISLLGQRVPMSLKVFLTALAILDDLGAILIIAFFYTEHIQWIYLLSAAVCTLILVSFNCQRIDKLLPYLIVGALLWLAIVKSGIHATVAGVILAFTIPLHAKYDVTRSPLKALESALHPWVVFAILPLFAFVNAGVSFASISKQQLSSPLFWGIILGLFLGKQIGVFGSCWLAHRAKWIKLPEKADWLDMYGVALLCGIGFTISLFIGSLAFAGEANVYSNVVRASVLFASVLSGAAGYCVLSQKRRGC